MADSVADLIAGSEPAVIGVDIPIGLPDRGPRKADLAARKRLGRRAATVFITPTRAALAAADYQSALAISREITGRGISAQAFGLARYALEVDRLRADLAGRLFEIHPEVSFSELNGSVVLQPKRSVAGQIIRRTLLADVGLNLPEGAQGRAQVDDVLDAAVVAWSAWRIHRGVARSMPKTAERFSDGYPAAIWF